MWRNISVWHIVVLVLALVLLFGWRRLPDMARSVGQSLRVFKTEVDEMGKDGKDKNRRDGVPREDDPTAAAPTTTPVPDPHAPDGPVRGVPDDTAARPGHDDVSPPAGTSSEQHRP